MTRSGVPRAFSVLVLPTAGQHQPVRDGLVGLRDYAGIGNGR
jgi:hypothetical protein